MIKKSTVLRQMQSFIYGYDFKKAVSEHNGDLAFLGLEAEYENVIMPKKKPKGHELTERQKISNKNISRVRVKIENAFAGVKRLRIVYHVSRTKRDHFIDQTFSVACGLCNYYLATK